MATSLVAQEKLGSPMLLRVGPDYYDVNKDRSADNLQGVTEVARSWLNPHYNYAHEQQSTSETPTLGVQNKQGPRYIPSYTTETTEF